MATTLRDLRLEEFSIVRGADKQPANPGAKALFYKSKSEAGDGGQDKREEDVMSKDVKKTALDDAEAQRKSYAEKVGNAIASGVEKALRTINWESASSGSETIKEEPGEPAEPAPLMQATDKEKKTEKVADKDEPTAQPAEKVVVVAVGEAVTKAVEPLTDSVVKLAERVEKLERKPTGSNQLEKGMPKITASDNSDPKFPEFTKQLEGRLGLTPGQKLSKAVISSGGWAAGIAFEEAGRFLDFIVDESVLLKQTRRVDMPNVKHVIDKIGLGGKVFVKGTPGVDPGDTVSLSGPTQITLDAEEILAIVSIGDDTLEDNIEGDAFVQHLLGMIARAGANEIEESVMHGDTAVGDTGILDRWDGWDKLARAAGAHLIEAINDADRHWPGTHATKATRLLKALPTKFRRDRNNLAFIQHPDIYLDYNDELAGNGSAEAFASISGIQDLPTRGVRNVQMPLFKKDIAFTVVVPYINGTMVWLTDLRNLIWGVHREIRIEAKREARKRATDYVISMRGAVAIEEADAIGIYDHLLVNGEPSQ